MKRWKKRALSLLLAFVLSAVLSGCVYAGNQRWEDLSPAQREAVRQEFAQARQETEAELDGENGAFARWVLDAAEEGLREP